MTTQTITLSPDQAEAQAQLWDAFQGGQRIITLAGGGGTGKTTSLDALVARLQTADKSIALLAPTWAAASVLRKRVGIPRDIPASSIHALLYGQPVEATDPVTGITTITFKDPQPYRADVVIIDEAGMVNKTVLDDLIAASATGQTCVLGCGDDGQLPPVEGRPGFDLAHPTARLTQIHRQAADSLIIKLATGQIRANHLCSPAQIARAGRTIGLPVLRAGIYDIARVIAHNIRGSYAGEFVGADCDVAIVNTNRSRLLINAAVRRALDFPPFSSGAPALGERVMALRTNHRVGVCNSEMGSVAAVRALDPVAGLHVHEIVVKWDGGVRTAVIVLARAWRTHAELLDSMDYGYSIPSQAFAQAGKASQKDYGTIKRAAPAGYGASRDDSAAKHCADVLSRYMELTPAYAVTAWKMQGAQRLGVLMVLESCAWMRTDAWKVWYTQATRAEKELVLVIPTWT